MKKHIGRIFIVLIFFMLFSGCDDSDGGEDDCEMPPLDCQLMPPTSGSVKIFVSNGYDVKVELFEGLIGDNAVLIGEYTVSDGSFVLNNMADGEYSARAYYEVEGESIAVTGGDDIYIHSEEYCAGIECWEVDDAEIDVSLDIDAFKDYLEGKEDHCFIATAAFGSLAERHVRILRVFRDRVLLENGIGRIFVKYYYRYSPPVAQVVGNSPLLRRCVRGVLSPITAVIMLLFPEIEAGMAWSSIQNCSGR